MKPKEGFIYLCLAMVGVDQKITEEEKKIMEEVFQKYGISEEEYFEIVVSFINDTIDEARTESLSEMAFTAIQELDISMKYNLLNALKEIAEADGIDDRELELIEKTKARLNL